MKKLWAKLYKDGISKKEIMGVFLAGIVVGHLLGYVIT